MLGKGVKLFLSGFPDGHDWESISNGQWQLGSSIGDVDGLGALVSLTVLDMFGGHIINHNAIFPHLAVGTQKGWIIMDASLIAD